MSEVNLWVSAYTYRCRILSDNGPSSSLSFDGDEFLLFNLLGNVLWN